MQRVSRTDLFLGFMKIGMLGFGGIAPWARRIIVEERGWLGDAEYAALLGVGQVLPGPNTMNASVMIGDRYQGALGAWSMWPFAAAMFGCVGLLRLPLITVVLVLVPLSAATAARAHAR